MPKLKHKKPCNQCPWRRKSAPGWLGAATPEEFLRSTLDESHMPCHSTIDYDDDDWKETQYPSSALCAGSLTFLSNTCKLPRDPVLAKVMQSVGSDHENVFSFADQFLEHHTKETLMNYDGYEFSDLQSVETEWGMFHIGDRVEVITDNEEFGYFAEQEADEDQGTPHYPADEGEVVGFSEIEASLYGPPRTAIYVAFDGRDPIEVKPGDVLVLA